MNSIDEFPIFILIAMFWYGFSLSFITLAWMKWLSLRSETIDGVLKTPRVPFVMQLAFALGSIFGSAGGAVLVGSLRYRVIGSDWMFITGVVAGVLLAYLLILRSKVMATKD